MFSWINKQGVRSSNGFEVQSVDRFSIAYRKGSQSAAYREWDYFWALEYTLTA